MQQHVLLPDRSEHVVIVVLHPLGHPWRKGGPQQVGARIQHQLLDVGHADQPVDLDHLFGLDVQLVHDD